MNANVLVTNAGRSVAKRDSNGPRNDSDQRYAQIQLVALMATILVLGLAYAPNFYLLASVWLVDPNYSHGWLVFPIALVILWQRVTAPESEPSPSAIPRPWLGWCSLATILAVRALAYEGSFQWLESATILPAIACLVWSFGSWPLLRRAWPAIAFLVFMLPLPDAVNNWIALPLQETAATGSCFLLQLSGLWSIQEGNVINLRTASGLMEKLDVAAACNGLKMLMTLTATITATIILVPLPTWKRIVLMVSVVPIALISNITRIVATGFCYYLLTGGCGLQLMSSVKDVSEIPTKGKELIIVATVDNVLHFRMFGGDGTLVVETDEKKLAKQAPQIEVFRKQLVDLQPPHELTASEKDRAITTVTSIVGHTLSGSKGKAWAHDITGWLMMPMALLLVGLELATLSWLVPTEDESDDDDGKLILKQLSHENPRRIIPKKGQDPRQIIPKKGQDPEV
jgi:exosortase